MRMYGRIIAIAALVAAVAGIVALKQTFAKPGAEPPAAPKPVVQEVNTPGLPRLLDLGADKCIPCKMMAPVLEDLKQEYAGRVNVEFIDVWKNPAAAKEHNVPSIPTQIFFDASGKELFRHTGFFAKEDIVAKWKELGMLPAGAKNGD